MFQYVCQHCLLLHKWANIPTMRCEAHGGWLLVADRRSFASVHNKGGYPTDWIPAFPMCHRLLCLRVVFLPVATDGVVTPGSRPHHTERQHCRYWLA
jgi:hypothetical protein